MPAENLNLVRRLDFGLIHSFGDLFVFVGRHLVLCGPLAAFEHLIEVGFVAVVLREHGMFQPTIASVADKVELAATLTTSRLEHGVFRTVAIVALSSVKEKFGGGGEGDVSPLQGADEEVISGWQQGQVVRAGPRADRQVYRGHEQIAVAPSTNVARKVQCPRCLGP